MGKKTKMILSLGAIISLPIILMSVIAYAFDLSDAKWFGWISMLVFVLSIVFVQRYYRNNFYGGYISYSKLLGGTMLMVLIASVIMFIYTYVFYEFIAPEQLDKMLNLAEANLYEQELSKAQIDSSLEMMKKYVLTPIALSIFTVFLTFIQGFIVALISSAFIKKNTDAFAEAMKGVENE